MTTSMIALIEHISMSNYKMHHTENHLINLMLPAAWK